MSEREAVLLVHGLWTGPWAFAAMRSRFAHLGLAVHMHAYDSVRARLTHAARDLAARMREIEADRVHVVAHSLGGIVTYRALCLQPRAGNVVMLGTPWRGSQTGERLARLPLGTTLRGHCLADWLADPAPCWDLPNLLGVIGGTRSLGLGRLIAPRLARPNDGAVTLAETTAEGMRARLLLPVSHSGMLLSARVARQVGLFLRNGHFSAET